MTISEFINDSFHEFGARNILKIVGCTVIGTAVGFGIGVAITNNDEEDK